MVPVHRWWSGQSSGKSGRVRTHPVGDMESARLVHCDRDCEGRRELCQPRLGPHYTERISFSLARRGGLGFKVRTLGGQLRRSNGRHSVKAYLLTTGTIFGLFAAGHVFELVAEWRPPASDPWFTVGMALIIGGSGALSVWAFRLLKGIGSSPLV